MVKALMKKVNTPAVRKFVIAGLLSFVIDYVILLSLHFIWQVQINLATTIGYGAGLFINFLINKYWTFDTTHTAKQTSRQAGLYGVLVGVNLLFANICVSIFAGVGIGPALSKPIATGLITVLNFVVYQKLIFKSPPAV